MMLVCRSWHQVIADTPAFWKFVWIGAGTGPQDVEGGRLKGLLRRSGQLPLSVMIAPELINRTERFHTVPDALQDQLQRVGTLSMVKTNSKISMENMPSADDIQQLLQHPLPSLERLNVGAFQICWTEDWPIHRLQIMVDSPQLQELSCHYHFIFPTSPLHLISISLISVNPSSLAPDSIELPLLLDLRLARCELATLLSAFVTPSLRRLFVDEDVSPSPTPPSLRPYPNLEELQWTDRGPDPVFSAFLPLCPNLIRYSNYQVGDEENIKFKYIDTPAIILSMLPGKSGENDGPRAGSWPKLEEVLLDVGQCDDVSALIEAIPSIQRIRILQNFTTRSDEEARAREIMLLPSLRKMVDIAFWLDPWGSNLGMHFERTEGA
ncbi:hypothetical protein FS837_000155 [Tulasnella sp. UAMH 9824]|nr:hypothetical protein FS837_000155 [Tulasnella sp. UAMH 9824]